jgi:hypothetical protein
MGLLGTRWEAEYEGHRLVVTRNELTRGFALEWDGVEIARRTWSLIGLGELHASAEVADPAGASYRTDGASRTVDVKVVIYLGSISEPDGKCLIVVDGHEVPVRQADEPSQLLTTRWQAEHEGHKLEISRNEMTRGFSLAWDGEQIAHRRWSLVGIGELHASANVAGSDGGLRPVDVKIVLNVGGECTAIVDGREVPVRKA